MKKQKLETKLEFEFEEQDDLFEFDVDMEIKTRNKISNIITIESKKKSTDSSTKLF